MNSRLTARPTIIDVAATAGVSKSLVSLVLRGASSVSEEKRRLVLAAAAELGYRPNGVARSLVQRRSNLFGVLLSDLHNAFFAEVIDGVQAEAGAHGYNTIMSVVDHRTLAERRALDTLLDLRIDGLLLAGPMLEINAMTLPSKEIPVVMVARRARMGSVDSVSNDDLTGASLVVQHLADIGHQHIVHIDGGGGAGAAERRKGYERAMQRRGLDAFIQIIPGSYSNEGGRQGVAALVDSGVHPTAIFVANDLAALGALSALSERGLRVPDDISVVGYDNTALAAVSQINLTTVDQPRPDMGRTAVTLLLERLGGRRDAARHVLLPPKLVVRGTTAPWRSTSKLR
ncbi:MAG: LacI family DNA-binding transcriptional regulator [Phycisphaerae bacterium]|nr:LacI family DNA-binding transcriptional regulator [Gemmatimonadaceae bacterium]